MKNVLFIFLIIVFSNSYSQDLKVFFTNADSFLKNNVVNGRVNYSEINSNQESLNELLDMAKSIIVDKNDANTFQAFWINAYNLSVIKGIIDNYPTNSPLENAGFFDETKYSIGGRKITLNDIENKLLRAEFNDARFHFVLVCGALGCPPLISEAYLPNTLNEQLDEQTKIALNGSFLKVNIKKKRIEVSEIMKWYKEDFTRNGTNEIGFINKYRTEKIPSKFKITYFPYNWNINKQ